MDTTRTMITFKQGDAKFTYRVGGIAIHNGHVLLQKATRDPNNLFWFVPGGRAELGESAENTLLREMREELGVNARIERLLYVVENFFQNTSIHHELGMYFLMTLPDDCYLLNLPGPYIRDDEDGLPMVFEWLPLDQLALEVIHPVCLRTELQTLPVQTMHMVQTNGSFL